MQLPKSKNGYCPVCKRKLTTPESIERGIGPKCEKRLQEQQDNGSQQLNMLDFESEETVLTDEHKAINELAVGIQEMDDEHPEVAELITRVQQSFNGMMTGQCDAKKAIAAEHRLKQHLSQLTNQVEEVTNELDELESQLKQHGADHFTPAQILASIRRALADGAGTPE